MAIVALLLLLAAGALAMALTGWPSYAVLLAVACAIGAVGVAGGAIDASLLTALPTRVVGILDHDLLQAVALYAFLGALLRHIDLAPRVLAGLESAFARVRVARSRRAALSGYALALLAAPLNGAVAAAIGMLSVTSARRWRDGGLRTERARAFVAAAGSLGVLVPPSLVLILLGDAMLRAHTEGLQLGGITGVRIINTQDLVQACGPAALVLAVLWGAVVAWRGATPAEADGEAAPVRPGWAAALAPLGVLLMLAGVATGWLRAVEAAATATLALFAYAALGGQLGRGRLAAVFDDAMATTGALFALLLAATTLSLMLRAAGCDRLVAAALQSLAASPGAALAAVLGAMLLLALVLDAFELVFLVVPIVMPPLLALGLDAAWVACLTLLTLQLGYLLPPWGYAVALARTSVDPEDKASGLPARELGPFIVALVAVVGLVAAWPTTTHWWRSAPEMLAPPAPGTDVDELMRQMSSPREGRDQGSPSQ